MQMLDSLRRIACWIGCCIALMGTEVQALVHHPDVSSTLISFSYADDLWVVPLGGGKARRVTVLEGREIHGRFSPDGSSLAFTGVSPSGAEDVYTLDLDTLTPIRLTFHPEPDRVLDWYPDGSAVLIASSRESFRHNFNQFYRLSVEGGLPQKQPLVYGEKAGFSPDGKSIVFTYKKDFQDGNETWKRYRGGRAPDIWSYRFSDDSTDRLTSDEGVDTDPMWGARGVYFLSERGAEQRANLWLREHRTGNLRQLTNFSEYDVKHPAIGADKIVFTQAGRLYLLDLESEQFVEVPLELPANHPHQQARYVSVNDQVGQVNLSHEGDKLLLSPGGELLVYQPESQLLENLSGTSGVAERYASFSPDGEQTAYVSDSTGEYQLYVRGPDGDSRQLGDFAPGFLYPPQWSPDSRYLALFDQRQRLFIVRVANGEHRQVNQGAWRGHFDLENATLSWSADSRWLLYTVGGKNRNKAVYAHDVAKGQSIALSSGYHDDFEAVFCGENAYICMLSRREFNPVFGDIDTTWTYTRSGGVYVIPLDVATPVPFQGQQEAMLENSPGEPESGVIDRRVVKVPVPDGDLFRLRSIGHQLLYQRGEQDPQGAGVYRYDWRTGTEERMLADGELLAVAENRVLLRHRDQYVLRNLNGNDRIKEFPLPELNVWIEPKLQNRQILREAWRYLRDFFYDSQMHGLDWPMIYQRYANLLPEVVTQDDLNQLVRDVGGELSAGHIWATESFARKRWSNDSTGLLGADIRFVNGGYRIEHIMRANQWLSSLRSPLAGPGIDIAEGDYIIAVDDRELDVQMTPWRALEHKTGRVRLTVSDRPRGGRLRYVEIETILSERRLRELEWVESNRHAVAEATDDRVGYIYLTNTARNGQDDLMRQYRAQSHKTALIVDARFNTGGALGDRLIELLNRPVLNYFNFRNSSNYPLPELANGGPKIALTNGWSYSGGDGFPFLFQQAKLGPVLGTRTWGGLVGPSLPLPLVNNGRISAPPQRVQDRHGNWGTGGDIGVTPDIRVENTPGMLLSGRDLQLEKAIAWVREKLGS
ncbi:S41 family peptidase [Parahaliea mediterranea]|uniref:Tricorn protease homolog n=1 Tax=Parahaliea mediterranea TaxID=651086 RepID=A0A939DG32_9GAMM|nr:S41 family peptidase [Parahaliea mediterranea]MBN7797618.1 PDZ domain-containing protein [Parahaliea mediterranea]